MVVLALPDQAVELHSLVKAGHALSQHNRWISAVHRNIYSQISFTFLALYITVVPYYISTISFRIRLGGTNPSGCEQPDNGEDVIFEYKTNVMPYTEITNLAYNSKLTKFICFIIYVLRNGLFTFMYTIRVCIYLSTGVGIKGLGNLYLSPFRSVEHVV